MIIISSVITVVVWKTLTLSFRVRADFVLEHAFDDALSNLVITVGGYSSTQVLKRKASLQGFTRHEARD